MMATAVRRPTRGCVTGAGKATRWSSTTGSAVIDTAPSRSFAARALDRAGNTRPTACTSSSGFLTDDHLLGGGRSRTGTSPRARGRFRPGLAAASRPNAARRVQRRGVRRRPARGRYHKNPISKYDRSTRRAFSFGKHGDRVRDEHARSIARDSAGFFCSHLCGPCSSLRAGSNAAPGANVTSD